MMRGIVSVVAFVAMAGVAQAEPTAPGRFSGSVSVGADFPVDGDVHGGATSTVPLGAVAALRDAGAPALALPPAAANAQLRIGARSFDDIYGEALSINLEGAYGLTGNREVFGAIGYTQADEGTVQVGTAAVINASGGTLVEVPVFGTFGEYNAVTVEGGVRQFFGGESALKPYVAGRLGAAFVDEIRASFRVPALNITRALNDVAFYDETTVLTAGLDVGVSYAVTPTFSVMAETGIRYFGDLDGNDSNIGGLGLASINEEGSRISIPVSVRGRVKF